MWESPIPNSSRVWIVKYHMKQNIVASSKIIVVVLTAMLSTFSLTGCIQSEAAERFAYSSDVEVSETAIKLVNATFKTTFLGGDWYYQGAQAKNGTINAYIQIPTQLEMAEKQQKRYLKMAICPDKSRTRLWQQLQDIPLSVHVYTMNKKFTVYAHCDNPLV